MGKISITEEQMQIVEVHHNLQVHVPKSKHDDYQRTNSFQTSVFGLDVEIEKCSFIPEEGLLLFGSKHLISLYVDMMGLLYARWN